MLVIHKKRERKLLKDSRCTRENKQVN
jgi:hypothetical protein